MQLRVTKEGTLNAEIKRGNWNKLISQYKELLRKQNKARMSLNGYIRLDNVNLNVLTVLLLVGLS